MAFDEGLAERIREIVSALPECCEKKMFGGLAFLNAGHMFVGILGDALMARVGPVEYEAALARPHVRPMDFTGKPLRGYVYVDPPAYEEDAALLAWIEQCRLFAESLPPKPAKPARRSKGR